MRRLYWLLPFLAISLACLQINLSLPAAPTPTSAPAPSPIVLPTATESEAAAMPAETWCLFWSPSYCLEFDPALWQLSASADQARELVHKTAPDCRLSEQGPMGMPMDITQELIGSVQYSVVDRLYTSPPFVGFTASQNPDPATQNSPHFFLYVSMPDHFDCQANARQVLATLRLK